MNIWKISIQNLKTKPLYTILSIFSLSLSIALLLGIQQLKSSFTHQMEHNLGGIDLVVGAKGSPLQLVLSSVLHLDNPTGNISYKEAKKLEKNRMIKSVVPISYGDNHKGFRIVGTTAEFVALYNAVLQKGEKVKKSMQVILGATVAERLKLDLGDTFLSSHGLIENDIDVHEDVLTVVGILKPTRKVIDRLIITNLESIWDVHNHEVSEEKSHEHESQVSHEDGEHHEHDDHDSGNDQNQVEHKNHHEEIDKEITSLLISFRNPMGLLTFPRKINESTNMQAALPKFEIDRLFEYTGIGFTTISWIAYLILLISGMTIFISLYKMVKERAYDLALLRSYGANNFQLIKMVAYEAIIIASLAFVSGCLFIKVGFKIIFNFMNSSYKKHMLLELTLNEILSTGFLVLVMILLSVALAIYPIIKMNISTILSHEK